jgi:hypothetical protein
MRHHGTWRDEEWDSAGNDSICGTIFFDEIATVPDWMWRSSGMAVRRCDTDVLVIDWWIDLPEGFGMFSQEARDVLREEELLKGDYL